MHFRIKRALTYFLHYGFVFFVISLVVSCHTDTKSTHNFTQTEEELIALTGEEFNGELAFEITDYVQDFWRLPGNSGFDSSIFRVKDLLEQNGFVPESKAGGNDRFIYRLEEREMKLPTWEPISANLTIVGDSTDLLDFRTNRNMVAINSHSTPVGGITGRVVEVKDAEQLEKISVDGKIIYTTSSPWTLSALAAEKNALGIIFYKLPAYLKPEKNTTSIQFRKIKLDQERRTWAIGLSYSANTRLMAAMRKGAVDLSVNITTNVYQSRELTLVADILGSELPKEKLVFSAHLQEPGANDNATGVGVALEMATVTAKLIKEAKLDLRRTITFLWGDEIQSTKRYVAEQRLAERIKWGISLDMVGENTALTGGSFLIEKMPDPSAIWTRGIDQHSEWGGSPLTIGDMKPHYLNDFVANRFRKRAEKTGWSVKTNPYEGGSDHVPFLEAEIPSVLFWHFTDQFYHTDNDRIDKVSVSTLTNVGNAALNCAYVLANANRSTALMITDEIRAAGIDRLQEELKQGFLAIEAGESKVEQIKIIEAWSDWYEQAIRSTDDLFSGDPSLNKERELAVNAIRSETEICKEAINQFSKK
ncbi:MAG: M28 family peptidase [Cyclobacteriaceae bacterium]